MKKLLAFGGVLMTAAVTLSALSFVGAPTASATSRCTVEANGDRARAFTINGHNATVTFKATGAEGCTAQVSANSFYAPTMDGRPYSKQVLFDRSTRTVGKGTHTMSVSLPSKSTKAKGCFYQVDLTYGTNNVQPVLAYGHGTLDCTVPTPPTPPTPPKPPVTPPKQRIEVCDLTTKQRAMVREGYDIARYTTDFSKCHETPVTVLSTPPTPPATPEAPALETPEELPETGPVQAVAQFLGAGSMVASTGYYVQSRRRR